MLPTRLGSATIFLEELSDSQTLRRELVFSVGLGFSEALQAGIMWSNDYDRWHKSCCIGSLGCIRLSVSSALRLHRSRFRGTALESTTGVWFWSNADHKFGCIQSDIMVSEGRLTSHAVPTVFAIRIYKAIIDILSWVSSTSTNSISTHVALGHFTLAHLHPECLYSLCHLLFLRPKNRRQCISFSPGRNSKSRIPGHRG